MKFSMKPTTHIWTKIGGRQNWFQKVKKKLLSNFAGKIICKKLTPNDPYNSVRNGLLIVLPTDIFTEYLYQVIGVSKT